MRNSKFAILVNVFIFIFITCNAQVSKTVTVPNPGFLGSQFTWEETFKITNLKISGKLNALDFKFLSQNFNLLETIDLGSCTIYSYNGSDGPTWASSIYYPENELPQNSFSNTYTNSGVKQIYGRKTLKSIILPSNITSIGTDAFNECTGLTSIKMPATLQTIKDYAFQNCTSLTSIQCLSSVPPVCGIDALTGINASACTMTVPTNAVSTYQTDAAWKNFKFTGGGYSIYLTNSNECAGTVTGQEYRFYTLNEAVKLKAIPTNSKTSISWNENGNVVSTDSIYSFQLSANRRLTVNFTRAENYYLIKPGTLSNFIKNPQTITHLTVSGNIDARDIRYIRDSLRAVQYLDLTRSFISSYYGPDGSYVSTNLYNDNVFPTWAFFTYDINKGNRYLTTVKLPTNIVTIEYNAFNNCRKIDTITIPQSVTAIKEFAFGYCTSLKSIKNLSLQPAALTNTIFTDVTASACELLVPEGSESSYKAAPFWSNFNVKTGGYSISVKCNNDLIGSVSGVENRFYTQNESLKMKATAIHGSVFKNWTENGIILSTDSTFEIMATDNRLLYANFGLEETLKTDNAGTLKNLITNPKVITSLTLSGKLDVRDFQFIRDSIPSLETLDITNTQIKAYTIQNTSTSYKDDQLPNCAFSAESYPCAGMKFLKTIILPQGMTSIGDRAFYNCFALENVSMPLSLKSISTNAFGNCTGMKTLCLPSNLSSVGYTAFAGCNNLQTVNNFGLTPFNAGNDIFNGVQFSSCNLKVPNGTLNAYKASALWNTFNMSEGGFVVTATSNELTTGTVSGSENRFYTSEEPVTLQCSALNGTTFQNWTDNGKIVSTDNKYTFHVSTNHNLTAVLTKEAVVQVDVPGTLKDKMPDRISTTGLTVTGKIDARDIQFLRDSLPALEDLNLRKSSIMAFSGKATVWEARNFYANAMPMNSFYNSTTMLGKSSLKSIILPDSLTVIDGQSFQGCTNLTTVTFPSKLTTIYQAFWNCSSLTTMVIPPTVTTLSGSFNGCTKLNSITLPESLIRIDQESFKGCTSLKSIHIPNGVKDILYSAFEGCSSLEKLRLPDALTYIYHNAFANCTAIDSLKLPSKLSTIDDNAFIGCNGLKDISFGEALPILNQYAFANCIGITKLVFPRKLKAIGPGAFQNCTAIASIAFPDDLTSLGSGSFAGCTSLVEVKVPNKVTDLDGAFVNCTGLKKVILQTGLKRIINSGFGGCTALTSISIPSGVTYLSNGAFQDCTSLLEVYLPSGLTNIGSSAFSGCSSLKSIQLPTGFTKLEGLTFKNCSSLTTVTLPVELSSMFMLEFWYCNKLTDLINMNPVPLPSSSLANTFNDMDQTKCKLIVQSSSVNAYKAAVAWNKFIIVDGGYTVIASPSNSVIGAITGANRFYQPNEVATLEATTKLGSTFVNWTENGMVISTNPVLAFSVTSNRNLQANFYRELTVNMPEGGNLRDSVYDSNSVSKLTVTGNIDARDIKFMRDNLPLTTYIDLSNAHIATYTGSDGTVDGNYYYAENTFPNSAFMNNKVLKTILLNKELVSIESNAFSGCIGLNQCTLSESILSIGNNAFYNCTNLNFIKLPDNLISIEYSAFSGCTGLASISFPADLQKIGSSAFIMCTGLTTLSLPSGLKKMDESAFSLCKGLTRVVFPKSLSVISMLAFSACTNISSLEFPEGITQISYGAFSGCSGLQTLSFPASLNFIGTGAFSGCSGLTEMSLSSGLAVLAENSFLGCTRLKKITNPNSIPIELSSDVFSGVNQGTCSLLVPSGSENAYRNAPVWKYFNISGSGYSVSALSNNPLVGSINGLTNKMFAKNETLTLTAEGIDGAEFINWTENNIVISTDPIYTFTVTGNRKLTANFKREVAVIIPDPGTLKNTIKNALSITSLILTGNIDARDIKQIRDNFPSLLELDLKNSYIKSYSGNEGTNQQISFYPEKEMPEFSFNDPATGLKSHIQFIKLSDDLDSIGRYAFTDCSNLKAITLPEHLKSIETGAFFGCTGLDTITLPAGLKFLKSECFSKCDALKRIINLNPQPISITNDVFTYAIFKSCKLIVPDASVDLYKTADIWKGFFEIAGISSYLKSIPDVPFLIYPVPAKDIIYIKKNDSIKINSMKIVDLNGKVFWNSNMSVSEINISSFPANNYILEVNTSTKRFVQRFFKK